MKCHKSMQCLFIVAYEMLSMVLVWRAAFFENFENWKKILNTDTECKKSCWSKKNWSITSWKWNYVFLLMFPEIRLRIRISGYKMEKLIHEKKSWFKMSVTLVKWYFKRHLYFSSWWNKILRAIRCGYRGVARGVECLRKKFAPIWAFCFKASL